MIALSHQMRASEDRCVDLHDLAAMRQRLRTLADASEQALDRSLQDDLHHGIHSVRIEVRALRRVVRRDNAIFDRHGCNSVDPDNRGLKRLAQALGSNDPIRHTSPLASVLGNYAPLSELCEARNFYALVTRSLDISNCEYPLGFVAGATVQSAVVVLQ